MTKLMFSIWSWPEWAYLYSCTVAATKYPCTVTGFQMEVQMD